MTLIEIAIVASGITLFLYAFKLCEYFESETKKALDRIKDLHCWYNDNTIEWDNSEKTEIRSLRTELIDVANFYIEVRGWAIYLPNILLFGSFVLAIVVVLWILTKTYLEIFGMSYLVVIPYLDLLSLIIWSLYGTGAAIPVILAGIPMMKSPRKMRRPTKRFLEVRKKYFDKKYPAVTN